MSQNKDYVPLCVYRFKQQHFIRKKKSIKNWIENHPIFKLIFYLNKIKTKKKLLNTKSECVRLDLLKDFYNKRNVQKKI